MAEGKYAAFPQVTRDWIATLSPEELAAFDASVEFGNQEMMAEVQRKLPERLRFGGEFGLPSALGYGKDADSRAQIRNYTAKEGIPTVLGAYDNSARGLGITPKHYKKVKEQRKIDPLMDSPIIDFISGKPDFDSATGAKGVSVFQPSGRSSMERAYNTDEGFIDKRGGRHTQAGTISHELTHKFFDSPAFLDFLEETGRNRGKPFTSKQDHAYIESVQPVDEAQIAAPAFRALAQDDYRELLNDFKQWATPEKQEKYGIRLPVEATKPEYPSMLDNLIDFIKGR